MSDYPHDNNCECADDDFNGDGKIDFADWIIFSKWIEHGKPGIKKLREIMKEFSENPENKRIRSSASLIPVKIPRTTNADYEESNSCVSTKDLAIYHAYSDWGATGDRPEPTPNTLSAHINSLSNPKLNYSQFGNYNLKHIPLKKCKPVCRDALHFEHRCEDSQFVIDVENTSNAKVRLDYYKWKIDWECGTPVEETLDVAPWENLQPSNAIWTDCEGKLWLRANSSGTVKYNGCPGTCTPTPTPTSTPTPTPTPTPTYTPTPTPTYTPTHTPTHSPTHTSTHSPTHTLPTHQPTHQHILQPTHQLIHQLTLQLILQRVNLKVGHLNLPVVAIQIKQAHGELGTMKV